jgi:dihydrodipicolinate synthase/N-acetylneuraminate lyase
VSPRLHGAIAAAVTPMRDGGRALDLESVGSLARFLADGGVDGALIAGTTGEGVLLTVDERRRLTERWIAERPDGFAVAVHAGAQSTQDTVALAAHALETGADAVAVIAPPYYHLDTQELLDHFVSAANACDPLPFYVYEFAARSGYAIRVDVIERLRGLAPNMAGLKVSDLPYEAVEPYLIDGLDVFIGQEPLTLEGMKAGAVGAVSGLATAWPDVVARLVHDRDASAHERVTVLREAVTGLPFHGLLKAVLSDRGVLTSDDVRPPLRRLTQTERASVRGLSS